MKLRKSLFWDVDIKTINLKRHARYIIERILDFGNDHEVRWMWKKYQKGTVRSTLKKSRIIHNKSRSLWSLLLK